MRILHIADVHLGAVPDEGKPWSDRRKQELWDTFAEVVELAGEEKADFLLIAGDLFHRQPLLRELKEVNYLFSRIPRTKVILMAGNHDYLQPNSYYRTFQWEKNVYFLSGQQIGAVDFPKENVCIYGASYWQREIRSPLYEEIEIANPHRINILLAHGGDSKHIPFSAASLAAKGFEYVACGHIHKPEVLAEPTVVMAGSLQPIDVNDTGMHGYWFGEIEKRGVSMKFYPIRKCEYVHMPIAVHGKMTNAMLQEKIAEILSYAEPFQIYKFILSGRKSPDIIFDLEKILKMDYVAGVTDATVPDYDFEKLRTEYEGQLIGRFIRAMEQRGESAVVQKAMYYGVDALCKTMRNE